MKKMAVLAGIVFLAASVPAGATSWQMVPFDSIVGGAVSYNAGGANVVVPGGAFYQTIHAGGILGTQVVGGDGIDLDVKGNLAIYAVVNYRDPDGVLTWAATHPTVPFDLELRLEGMQIDLTGDSTPEIVDSWRLGDDGPALVTTFAALGQWGYVELAPGVWMDIAVGQGSLVGKAAISVVLEDFILHGGVVPNLEGVLLAGDLGGPVAGQKVGSGMRIAAVPEPLTLLAVLGGVAGLGGYIRKRRLA